MDLIHGGDVVGYLARHGRPPLDFSASLNPLGLPPRVREAARRAVDAAAPYPDPLCRGLRAGLAAQLRVPEEWVLCGNGAADLIFRYCLAKRPRRALVTAPTFAEYERAVIAAGGTIDAYPLSENNGFQVDEGIVDAIHPIHDVLFLCQPNNPTGAAVAPGLLSAIRLRCEQTGTAIFADECFLSFMDEPGRHSLLGHAGSGTLFVLGSFTKLYAMAGLRLGYGVSGDTGLLQAMAAAGPPWPVSNVALAAGEAALGEEEYVAHSRLLVAGERERLARGLAGCGCRVFPPAANYVFFHAPRPDLNDQLMPQGILIRDCRNYRGLGPGYYRAAVRTAKENDQLLATLRRIMNG